MCLIVKGAMQIALREKTLPPEKADLLSFRKDINHKPFCRERCTVVLIDPKRTLNTWNAGGVFGWTRGIVV